jgi:glycosyltransferase involved in cell wall biosynthesis
MSATRVLVSGIVLDQPMGGVRRHNAELLPRIAKLLEAKGGELALLTGRGGLGFEPPANVRVIPSDVPSSPLLVRAARETKALGTAVAQAAEAGRPFNVVHVAHLPAPRTLPVPMSLTLHDLRSLDLEHTPFSRRLVAKAVVGRALQRARWVFTVSEHMRARLVRGWPEVEAKLLVAPNGADHLPVLPRDRAPDAPLLHVGHVEPRKNLDLLLRALALDTTLPDLLLVGAPKHDEDQRLIALGQTLQISHRLRLAGPCPDEDLPALLASAAAVVLPSHLEGFGIVALEAQRARVPLAISSAGALAETAAKSAIVFPPDDPQACALAIRQALQQSAADLEPAAVRAEGFTWDAAARIFVTGWAT